ncbi:ABC transporter permease [Rubrivirga sp. IMCC43871]|uniref:ABC transporter permease n=1 Tax=Rubrivirga sp. IMCC43871 TaxID=3391575 RepID=UPI00398FF8B9
MWIHHLRIALRALRRDAGYAALNGVGLTVALACCALIALFARAELSFDRFHHNADRLVLVGVESRLGQEVDQSVSSSYPVHLAAATAPGVEAATVMSMRASTTPILRPGERIDEADVMFASADFFDVFDFPAVAGDPAAALAGPGQAVLSESGARRLFGSVAGALGQPFRAEAQRDTQDVEVAAVVADPPRTSSVRFEVLLPTAELSESDRAPDSWGMRKWQTAARLTPGTTTAAFDTQMAAAVAPRTQAALDAGHDPERYFAVPLIYYRLSELNRADGFLGDPAYLALFSAAAALVLLLGLINYVNLATARAARRSREVGVRKALGAGRGAVAAQFLAEAVVLTVLSGLAALVVAALAVPAFNAGFGTDLRAADLDAPFVIAVLAASVVVGLLAGAYPAAGLARLDPASVLRGASSRSGKPSRNTLRRGLVAVQFAVAIGLIAATGSVLRQVDYASEADLGFEAEGVVAIPLKPDRGPGVPWEAAFDVVRQSPHVAAATTATSYPGAVCCRFSIPLGDDRPDEFIMYANLDAEAGYTDVLGLDLVAGRPVLDGEAATVVNEAFVDAMGWPSAEAAIGRTIEANAELEVVGVARDFRFESWRTAVEPAAIHEAADNAAWGYPKSYRSVLVRFEPGRQAEGLAALRQGWDRLGTDQPFEPAPLADTVAEMYASERRLAGVLGGFALVAVIVACLGLVGLAAYTAQRRTKEIGVRRALGASVGQVVALLSREYAVLLALAAVVAVPAAVLAVRTWLEGFAYRAPLSPLLFVGAIALTALLALAVVGVQAARAARISPTTALRTE